DFGSLPSSVAEHMQSWLYRVDPELSATDSRFLFLYESGASYWLGTLAPDGKKVSYYNLDNDNKLKAGALDFEKKKPFCSPFGPAPKRLESDPPLWVSNSEFLYRSASGKLVRASLVTGKAAVCPDCAPAYEKAKASTKIAAKKRAPGVLGPDTKIL